MGSKGPEEGGPGTTAALRGLPASQPLAWGAGGGHFLREAPDSVPFEFLKFLEGDPGLQEPALDCPVEGQAVVPGLLGLGCSEEVSVCTHAMHTNPGELKRSIG